MTNRLKPLSREGEAGEGVKEKTQQVLERERERDGGVSDLAGYQVKYEFFQTANDLVSILKRLESAPGR